MIQVQGKNNSWIVYSISGDPLSDVQIEQKITEINNIPVKAYILGGFLDTETTFDKLDTLLSQLREIGMTPGDFGVIIDLVSNQILLVPEDDLTDIATEDSVEIE